MKLSTVISSVNNNAKYYMFIPEQILFWKKFNINFIAIFVGDKIPDELLNYRNNIILWNKNLDLNTSYVAQNLRMYYTSLIKLPDNEMVMITDMDMLPTKGDYYKNGLENFKKEDFIYYRNIDCNQIYMCYNASHPDNWSKIFNIYSEKDIEEKIIESYNSSYDGIPGSTGWFIDQEIMYKKLINYEHLKVLNRPIKRLEVDMYYNHLNNNDKNFISDYDDCHFHRDYFSNKFLILDAKKQLLKNKEISFEYISDVQKINLITSFYILDEDNESKKKRNIELVNSLVNNINCPFIKKIHLFVDDEKSLHRIHLIPEHREKLFIIKIQKQPLYSELFEYAIDNLQNEICMIANSDIYLYECDMNCLNNINNNIFALTRYEDDLSSYFIDSNCGGTHDAFIFKSPLNKNILDSIKHYQNIWGSENSVITSLIDNGNYKIYNPCYQIRIVHLHSSGYRNEDRERIAYSKYDHPPCYY